MKALEAVLELFVLRFAQDSCVCKEKERACDALYLGSLMLAMKSVGLAPGLLGDKGLRLSLDSMYQKLIGVQLWRFPGHGNCNPDAEWQSRLFAAMEAWPTALDQAFGQFSKQG